MSKVIFWVIPFLYFSDLNTYQMHELSIVMGILDIAEKEVKKSNSEKVDEIQLEIGELAGIEMEALNYSWEVAIPNTILANAKREIDFLEGKGICLDCNTEFEVHHYYDNCTNCGSFLKNITQGKELRVKSLIVS